MFAEMLKGDYADIRMELRVGTGDTIIMIDGPNGLIYTKGFTGIDGSAKGFRFTAFDEATGGGLIEVNNIKTKNMSSEGGTFNNIKIIGNSEIGGNSTVKGTISGTLNGLNLVTSGNVTPGTLYSSGGYVLKSNNNAFILPASSRLAALTENRPVKVIKTTATGICRLRVGFPFYERETYTLQTGQYRIVVNGNPLWANDTYGEALWRNVNDSEWDNNADRSDAHEYIINLRAAGNTSGSTIELYLKCTIDYMASYDILNTTFELLCAESPGLLALLG
jgi:hypothetical protein